MMTFLERYELILTQGVQELRERVPEPPEGGWAVSAAEDLGDILYRLTIEHGLPFATFRETVMGILLEEADTPNRTRFAPEVARWHGLIVLALEMLPIDVDW